jgi:hypothetical protein
MIGAVTMGLFKSQAKATAAGGAPYCLHNASYCSSLARCLLISFRDSSLVGDKVGVQKIGADKQHSRKGCVHRLVYLLSPIRARWNPRVRLQINLRVSAQRAKYHLEPL